MNIAIQVYIGASLVASLAAAGHSDESRVPGGNGSRTATAAEGSIAADKADQGDGHGALDEAAPVLSPALSDTELDRYRGGQTTVAGIQNVSAIAQDNVITGDYVAGAVTISNSALSNFDGIGNIAINTGAQVNLQSVMNLTINITP
jgi:hypothetical protein